MLALIAAPAIAQDMVDDVDMVTASTPTTGSKYDRMTVEWEYQVPEADVEADADLGFKIFYIKGVKQATGPATPAEILAAEERLWTIAAIDAAMAAGNFVDAGKPATGPGGTGRESSHTAFRYTVPRGLSQDSVYAFAVLPYEGPGKVYPRTPVPLTVAQTAGWTTLLAPKPSRVREVELTPDDKMLMVEWQRPTNAGEAKLTVTGYEVQWRTSATADDAAGTDIEKFPPTGMTLTATEYEITGLINDVPYDVQVRAVNSAGAKGTWYPVDWATGTPSEDAMPADDEDEPKPTPALPLFGLLALVAGLVAAGRARLRR
jgi:hypothetical protein